MSTFSLKKLFSNSDHFRILYETDLYCVGHEFEYAYLLDKKNKTEIYLGDFYGDPYCGLISNDNKWCVVGGEKLVIWRESGEVIDLGDEDLKWIQMVRQETLETVRILIDPNSPAASVWVLNISTLIKTKVKDITPVVGELPTNFNW